MNWFPEEICHVLHTTSDIYGKLNDIVPNYSKKDVANYIKKSVGNLYHMFCHRRIHSEMEKNVNKRMERASRKSTIMFLSSIPKIMSTALLTALMRSDRVINGMRAARALYLQP